MERKIRVLNILGSLAYGGVESFIMNYYQQMDRNAIQMDFAVLYNTEKDLAGAKKFEEMGSKIYVFKTSITSPFKHLKEFKNILKREKYDAIHIHTWTAIRGIYGRVAKKQGVPLRIMHAHTGSVSVKSRLVVHKLTKFIVPYCCNYFFACSQAAANHMFGKRSYIQINNAINLDKFYFDLNKRIKTRNELKVDNNQIAIGHVGRIAPVKNHRYMVNIAEKAKNEGLKFKLFFVGGGNDNIIEELKSKIQEKGLTDYITFVGVRSDVENYYNAFDVNLLPSFFEGLPVSTIEAQACGCPSILSDKITKEVAVTDLVDFLPINDSNVSEWVERIKKSADIERNETTALIRSAGYDIKVEAQKLQNLYRELLLKEGVDLQSEE